MHVLWECPVYRNNFMGELDKLLGRSFEEFKLVHLIILIGHAGFIVGCENWGR